MTTASPTAEAAKVRKARLEMRIRNPFRSMLRPPRFYIRPSQLGGAMLHVVAFCERAVMAAEVERAIKKVKDKTR
jgi:hypothetical protein